jgi:hypothetical protein
LGVAASAPIDHKLECLRCTRRINGVNAMVCGYYFGGNVVRMVVSEMWV